MSFKQFFTDKSDFNVNIQNEYKEINESNKRDLTDVVGEIRAKGFKIKNIDFKPKEFELEMYEKIPGEIIKLFDGYNIDVNYNKLKIEFSKQASKPIKISK